MKDRRKGDTFPCWMWDSKHLTKRRARGCSHCKETAVWTAQVGVKFGWQWSVADLQKETLQWQEVRKKSECYSKWKPRQTWKSGVSTCFKTSAILFCEDSIWYGSFVALCNPSLKRLHRGLVGAFSYWRRYPRFPPLKGRQWKQEGKGSPEQKAGKLLCRRRFLLPAVAF